MASAMSAEAEEVMRRIEGFAKASGYLSPAQIQEIDRYAEVGKEVLMQSIKDLVSEAGGSPMMRSSSADGTQVQTRRRDSFMLPSGESFQRSGRETTEMLIINGFFRWIDHTGEVRTRAHLDEPTPLNWGKTADHIFDVCLGSFTSLRELGHKGLAVEHCCFDSAVHTALVDRFFAWHQVCATQRSLLDEGFDASRPSGLWGKICLNGR